MQKQKQKQQQQLLPVRAKLKRKPSQSQLSTAVMNQQGDMPACVHHGTDQSDDSHTRQRHESDSPAYGQLLGINLGITWLRC